MNTKKIYKDLKEYYSTKTKLNHIKDISFNEDIIIEIDGKQYSRNYNIIICKVCGTQRTPVMIKNNGGRYPFTGYHPEEKFNFNRNVCCSRSCGLELARINKIKSSDFRKSNKCKVPLNPKESVIHNFLYQQQ